MTSPHRSKEIIGKKKSAQPIRMGAHFQRAAYSIEGMKQGQDLVTPGSSQCPIIRAVGKNVFKSFSKLCIAVRWVSVRVSAG